MINKHRMGAPLPFGAALTSDVIVTEAGDFAHDDGIRVVLSGEKLVLLGSFDGLAFAMGVEINDLLIAIQGHNRAQAS